MKYDFDLICSRKGTSCSKWDELQKVFGRDDLIVAGFGVAVELMGRPLLNGLG